MNEATRAALETSIEHWETNAKAEHPSEAECWSDGCALCALFHKKTAKGHSYCGGCPVFERTRRSGCKETPWPTAARTWVFWDAAPDFRHRQLFRKHALLERDFLISLREEATE